MSTRAPLTEADIGLEVAIAKGGSIAIGFKVVKLSPTGSTITVERNGTKRRFNNARFFSEIGSGDSWRPATLRFDVASAKYQAAMQTRAGRASILLNEGLIALRGQPKPIDAIDSLAKTGQALVDIAREMSTLRDHEIIRKSKEEAGS